MYADDRFSIWEPIRADRSDIAAGVIAWVLAVAVLAAMVVMAPGRWPLWSAIGLAASYFVYQAIRGSFVREAFLQVDGDGLTVVHDGALRRPVVIQTSRIERVEIVELDEAKVADLYWPVPTLGRHEPNVAIFFKEPLPLPARSLMSRYRLEDPDRPGDAIWRGRKVDGLGLTLDDPEGAGGAVKGALGADLVETVFSEGPDDQGEDPLSASGKENRRILNEIRKGPPTAKSLPTLHRLLDDENPWTRGRAVKEIGRVGGAEAVQILIRAAQDGDDVVQMHVPAALAETHEPAALAPLLDALDSPDARARKEACKQLGKLGDPLAVPALTVLLDDDDLGPTAARSLAEVAIPETLPFFLNRWDERGWSKRLFSATDIQTAAIKAAETDRAKTVDILLQALPGSERSKRTFIIASLGEIGDSRALDAIAEAVGGRWDRHVALQALLAIDDPRALPAMKQAVRRVVLHRRRWKKRVAEMELRHAGPPA